MSEYPPPYQPANQAPKKSSNTALILFVVLGGLLLICGGMGYALYAGVSGAAAMMKPMISCVSGYEFIGKSIVAYAEANDGKLPPAATWQDDIRPFYEKVYKQGPGDNPFMEFMKPDGEWSCQLGEGKSKTGIAYNSDLAGKKLADFKDKEGITVLIYEVPEVKKNASGPYAAPKNPAPKHMMRDGWFYMTLDREMHGLSEDNKNEFKVRVGTD